MPTINELKKEALNDAGYSGSISDAEYKWLKAICSPYVGSIPDMWRYALLQAGYPNSVTVGQNEMLIDLGHTGAMPNKWYKYWRDTPLQGVGGSTIVLSATSIAESATSGSVVGTLSVTGGSGSYTFSITADPDNKFAIDGINLETDAALDHETATLHSVTIEADNGVDTPISRTFTITVTNVLEVTLNDPLTIDNDELVEASAAGTLVGTISGKTSGSTLTLIDDAGSRFALDGVDIEAGSVAVTIATYNITVRETHPDAATVDTVFTINGVAEASTAIAAPTEVTWIDGTNPPLFTMLVQEVAPDEVQVGDIPQIRYNGAGTVYSGAAVASFPLVLDFSGAGLPTLGAGAGYGQVRFVRDPGGGGEIIGDWSSASEGAFTIAATGLTYELAGWLENSTSGGLSKTATLDLGASAADRFVLFGAMTDGDVTFPGIPLSLPLIVNEESWGRRAFYGDFVPTGSGPTSLTVTASANTDIRCPVFVIRGVAGLVVKAFEIGTPATVPVEAGDLVIAIELHDNTETWTNSPTEPPDHTYSDGTTEFWKGWAAAFVIDAPNSAFSPGVVAGREARIALIVLGEV